MNYDDFMTDEPLENFLSEEEIPVFLTLTPVQQDRYLEAGSSYESMQKYLSDSDEPQAAKILLDLDSWK